MNGWFENAVWLWGPVGITCLLVKGWWLCGVGVAPPTQEVGCAIVLGVWWKGTDLIVCILMLSRLCCDSGNVCGLPVGFCGKSIFFDWEWASGWCYFGSPPSFRSLEYSKWTLLALAATPLQHTWLNGRGWIYCASCISSMWLGSHWCSSLVYYLIADCSHQTDSIVTSKEEVIM